METPNPWGRSKGLKQNSPEFPVNFGKMVITSQVGPKAKNKNWFFTADMVFPGLKSRDSGSVFFPFCVAPGRLKGGLKKKSPNCCPFILEHKPMSSNIFKCCPVADQPICEFTQTRPTAPRLQGHAVQDQILKPARVVPRSLDPSKPSKRRSPGDETWTRAKPKAERRSIRFGEVDQRTHGNDCLSGTRLESGWTRPLESAWTGIPKPKIDVQGVRD